MVTAALSTKAARALEQVKMGLTILYGADYFTEEEWMNVDRLIHKGQYIFTQGPQQNLLEEPLMIFDEAADTQATPTLNSQPYLPIEDSKNGKLLVSISEQQIPSPSSEEASTKFSPTETPNGTSAEGSSDEGQLPAKEVAGADDPPMFDFSKPTEPPLPEPSQSKPSSVNPPAADQRFSQEQLAEARALQASMTKAGQKKRPKYEKVKEDYPASEFSQNEGYPADITERPYDSPTPTDREHNIQSWANNVDTEQAIPEPTLSPFPSQTPKIPSDEDTLQPLSPMKSMRSASHTSSMTAKSVGKGLPPQLTPGEILVAKFGQSLKGIQMDIRPGDKIKYIKPVSGIMHIGTNFRTKITGQFATTILETPVSPLIIEQRRLAKQAALVEGLDEVEGMNAEEWDDVPATSKPKIIAPTPARPAGGLGASKYATLASLDNQSQADTERWESQGISRDEMSQMLDEKLAKVMAAQQAASTRNFPASRAPPASLGIKPKTSVCWFWKYKNNCRFEAHQCRDLHADLPPGTVETSNSHNGRPTWGALVDSLPRPISPASQLTSSRVSSTTPTCFYWATEGKCNNSDEACKYLHRHSTAGVAPRPGTRRRVWGERKREVAVYPAAETQSEWEVPEENDGASNWGDTTAESNWGESATNWGESTGNAWGSPSEDRYKPPHIKSQEEKEKVADLGW